MTRIERAIKEILGSEEMSFGNDPMDIEYNRGNYEGLKSGIEEGIEWADANPNWHKYPGDKPSKNGEYLVVFTSKYPEFKGKKWIEKTMFIDSGFCSLIFDEERDSEIDCLYKEDVIAWMELPQPPKFA